MIIATSIKSLWSKHKDELIKFYISEKNKPVTHANLEECYIDMNGKRYFRFPKSMGLPIDRLGMLSKYTQYLTKGLSPEEDAELDNLISEALEKGLKNPKHKSAAIIGSVIAEREKRKRLCFHTEIFYNYLAAQWVREDELPMVFDSDIQFQKVEQFKKEQGGENIVFFFHQPELKKLSDLLTLTDESIVRLSEESNTEIQILKAKINYLRSLMTTSQNGNETTEKVS